MLRDIPLSPPSPLPAGTIDIDRNRIFCLPNRPGIFYIQLSDRPVRVPHLPVDQNPKRIWENQGCVANLSDFGANLNWSAGALFFFIILHYLLDNKL